MGADATLAVLIAVVILVGLVVLAAAVLAWLGSLVIRGLTIAVSDAAEEAKQRRSRR